MAGERRKRRKLIMVQRYDYQSCEWCHPGLSDRCNGTIKCKSAAGYDEAQIKERTAYVCKGIYSEVRPIACTLQQRIVALVEAARSKHLGVKSLCSK